MKYKINKYYLIFILLFYFFLLKPWAEGYISILGYADELVAAFAIPLFLLKPRKISNYNVCIILMLSIGLLGSIVYGYQPFFQAALPDMFLCAKFWLAIYTGYSVYKNLSLKKYASKIFMHIKIATIGYLVLLVLDLVFNIFAMQTRNGLRVTHLIYTTPTEFVACCSYLFAILLAVKPYVKDTERYMIILAVLMLTTWRSKAFGTIIALALIYYFVYIRKKKIRLRTMLIFIPLAILVAWDQIQYYFFSSIQDDSARYMLLNKSITVANEHFPLGSGFATYGSHFSAVYYSPLYYKYNLSRVNGLSAYKSNFISDCFWPMIVGQFGWIGVLLFIIALALLIIRITKLRSVSSSYYAAGMGIMAYLLISSTAEAALVHPVAIPFALFLGLLFKQEEVERKNQIPKDKGASFI